VLEDTAVEDDMDVDGPQWWQWKVVLGRKPGIQALAPRCLCSADRTNMDKIHVILPLDELIGCLDQNFVGNQFGKPASYLIQRLTIGIAASLNFSCRRGQEVCLMKVHLRKNEIVNNYRRKGMTYGAGMEGPGGSLDDPTTPIRKKRKVVCESSCALVGHVTRRLQRYKYYSNNKKSKLYGKLPPDVV
jgi:hypothetical protein